MKKDKLFEVVSSRVGISWEDFKKFSDYYNGDYGAYGNEVYEDIKVRLVHLDNFLRENFWNHRFFYLWRDYCKFDQIIDIGFSVPYLPIYLNNIDKIGQMPKLLYVDINETSKQVAEIILEHCGNSADFVTGDVNNPTTWREINKYLSTKNKLFTAFETIEHFEHPEIFWNEIGRLKGSRLILSLPIGEKIPSHHLVFLSETEVRDYLNKYLDITESMVFEDAFASKYKIYTAIGTIK